MSSLLAVAAQRAIIGCSRPQWDNNGREGKLSGVNLTYRRSNVTAGRAVEVSFAPEKCCLLSARQTFHDRNAARRRCGLAKIRGLGEKRIVREVSFLPVDSGRGGEKDREKKEIVFLHREVPPWNLRKVISRIWSPNRRRLSCFVYLATVFFNICIFGRESCLLLFILRFKTANFG